MVAGSSICKLFTPWQSQMDGRTRRGATAICASGGGGPQCGLADARGKARQTGGIFAGSLELLLFTGKVGCVQNKIRECNSPNRSGSCHVRHRDVSGPGVRRYGYLCPKPDGPGQVYCGPTELWAATSPRQCSSGYADPGELIAARWGIVIRNRRGGHPQELIWTGDIRGCPVTPGSLRYLGKFHSGQLGALRWSHGFRYPCLVYLVQSDIVGPREAGSGYNQDVPPGIMLSLITRLLRAAQEDNLAEVKVPPDAGARRP